MKRPTLSFDAAFRLPLLLAVPLAVSLLWSLAACGDGAPARSAGSASDPASAGMASSAMPIAGSMMGSAGSPDSAGSGGGGNGGGPGAPSGGGLPGAGTSGSAGSSGGASGGPVLFPANSAPSFESHRIDKPGGTMFGQTSLVDIDQDGDLDFVAGARDSNVNWYEYQAKDTWVRHLIGGPARTDVGGVAFDIDGDGLIDHVSGGDWYRNPGSPRSSSFVKFATGMVGAHDNVAGDIDGDGKLDVVALNNNGMWWYSRGADPTAPWTGHQLTGAENVHGGAAVGDIDGDGDTDVTRVDKWLENADGKGQSWVTHDSFAFGKNGPFGVQTRASVIDLDGDGDSDVVQSEGDILNGRLAWFENVDGKGSTFTMHVLKDSGHQQDFHSLAVADFDSDGDQDIFSCGGPLTSGERKWLLWQNLDGKAQAFKETQLFAGVECHEAVAGDVDQDGDIDVCSKPWDGGDEHVYLENLLVP